MKLIHTDTQGTMYKLLNGSGTVVANYNYDPFGLRISNSAPTIYISLGFGWNCYFCPKCQIAK